MNVFRIIFILTALIFTGCSLIEQTIPESEALWGSDEPTRLEPSPRKAKILEKKKAESMSSVDIEKLPDRRQEANSVEVLWKRGGEKLDGYVLHYGSAPSLLDQEITLELSEIEQVDHPEHGILYRYVIEDLPNSDDQIFVSISAFRGSFVSERSETIQVKE